MALQFFVTFFSICHTPNRISINGEDFWKSIAVEDPVQEYNSSHVRLFIIPLHKDEGRGERGVQYGGTDNVQKKKTLIVGLVCRIQY